MDEEFLKRNTDCVYFLASPFTCKKGAGCEYRHSEMARLNPTDCWYWLSRSCLNPTCGYRHPPLDVHNEEPDDAEPLPISSSFPPSKNNVPCYFYSNGYCNRGAKCLFLHGPEDTSTSKQKNLMVVDAPPEDGRVPPDSINHLRTAKLSIDEPHTQIPVAKLSVTTEPVLDAPEKFPAAMRKTPKVVSENLFPWKKLEDMSRKLALKESPRRYAYESQETSITKSDSNQSDYAIKSEPSICSDQCSDEKDDSGVQHERWESSPEFDVLVKERTELFEDPDNKEYMLDYDDCYEINNVRHDNSHIARCYEDQQAYGGRFLREKRIHKPLYYSDNINDIVHCSDLDLREHLTNQRFPGDFMERNGERSVFSRCDAPFLSDERWEEPPRRVLTHRLHSVHQRLEPKLERKSFSVPMQRSVFFSAKQRRLPWNSQFNNPRRHHRHTRQKFSSKVQRRDYSRRKVNSESSHTVPKKLGRHKAEKRRVNADSTGASGQSYSVNFEGPKALSEILKGKVRSGGDDSNHGSSSAA